MSEDPAESIDFSTGAKLADHLIKELGDISTPATKGDIARVYATQLYLFDYCFAIYAMASVPSGDLNARSRSEADRALRLFNSRMQEQLRLLVGDENDQ